MLFVPRTTRGLYTHIASVGNRIAQTNELIAFERDICARLSSSSSSSSWQNVDEGNILAAENSCALRERAQRHATNTLHETIRFKRTNERMNERQFIFATEKMCNAFDFGLGWREPPPLAEHCDISRATHGIYDIA